MNRPDMLKAAALQHKLGLAYSTLLQGDRTAHLRHAITCYQTALQIYTYKQSPVQWAAIQHDLGNAYRDLPTNDLETAITCYQSALQVYNRDHYAAEWAAIQHDLGQAYYHRPATIPNAIDCYKAALQVYTRESFSTEWATPTVICLMQTYRPLLSGIKPH